MGDFLEIGFVLAAALSHKAKTKNGNTRADDAGIRSRPACRINYGTQLIGDGAQDLFNRAD